MVLVIVFFMLGLPLLFHVWLIKKSKWLAVKYVGSAGVIIGALPVMKIVEELYHKGDVVSAFRAMFFVVCGFYLLFVLVGAAMQAVEYLWAPNSRHPKKVKINNKNTSKKNKSKKKRA